jgi:hypothetical protein
MTLTTAMADQEPAASDVPASTAATTTRQTQQASEQESKVCKAMVNRLDQLECCCRSGVVLVASPTRSFWLDAPIFVCPSISHVLEVDSPP